LKTFHIAEGPGGFIEAIAHLRKEYNSSNNQFRTNDEIVKDAYWGLTLLKNEPGIPSWRKLKDKIRRDNIENVNFFMGKNEEGNLFDYENLEECGRNHYNSCDIVTADGGFDFSLNFEDQERVATKLLLVQILYAIILQKKGGTFIIKFFDMFNYASLELVYILKSFYSTVIVTKPKTSRYANSERYIVARHYIYDSSRIFIAPFISIIKRLSSEESNNENIMRILNIDLPHFFVSNMEQANILLGKQQLMTINNTNQLIKTGKNDKIEKMVKMNKEKSVKWCLENNIPHNKIRNENIFKKKNTMKM
jgi:23S rRNA U2552 (ribose-2'-O)-methylase RlmE/FtsJ